MKLLKNAAKAVSALALVSATVSPSFAQGLGGGLSSCDPVTGLSASGGQCVTLTPAQVSGVNPSSVTGNEGVDTLDPTSLGETYECNPAGSDNQAAGSGGSVLIEDCGAPLTITQTEPFFYGGAAPAPAPLPPAPAPATVTNVVTPAAQTVTQNVTSIVTPSIPAAAPAIPAAVVGPTVVAPAAAAAGVASSAIAAAGLGGTQLLIGGLVAAAVVGGAIAISDNDSSNNTN